MVTVPEGADDYTLGVRKLESRPPITARAMVAPLSRPPVFYNKAARNAYNNPPQTISTAPPPAGVPALPTPQTYTVTFANGSSTTYGSYAQAQAAVTQANTVLYGLYNSSGGLVGMQSTSTGAPPTNTPAGYNWSAIGQGVTPAQVNANYTQSNLTTTKVETGINQDGSVVYTPQYSVTLPNGNVVYTDTPAQAQALLTQAKYGGSGPSVYSITQNGATEYFTNTSVANGNAGINGVSGATPKSASLPVNLGSTTSGVGNSFQGSSTNVYEVTLPNGNIIYYATQGEANAAVSSLSQGNNLSYVSVNGKNVGIGVSGQTSADTTLINQMGVNAEETTAYGTVQYTVTGPPGWTGGYVGYLSNGQAIYGNSAASVEAQINNVIAGSTFSQSGVPGPSIYTTVNPVTGKPNSYSYATQAQAQAAQISANTSYINQNLKSTGGGNYSLNIGGSTFVFNSLAQATAVVNSIANGSTSNLYSVNGVTFNSQSAATSYANQLNAQSIQLGNTVGHLNQYFNQPAIASATAAFNTSSYNTYLSQWYQQNPAFTPGTIQNLKLNEASATAQLYNSYNPAFYYSSGGAFYSVNTNPDFSIQNQKGVAPGGIGLFGQLTGGITSNTKIQFSPFSQTPSSTTIKPNVIGAFGLGGAINPVVSKSSNNGGFNILNWFTTGLAGDVSSAYNSAISKGVNSVVSGITGNKYIQDISAIGTGIGIGINNGPIGQEIRSIQNTPIYLNKVAYNIQNQKGFYSNQNSFLTNLGQVLESGVVGGAYYATSFVNPNASYKPLQGSLGLQGIGLAISSVPFILGGGEVEVATEGIGNFGRVATWAGLGALYGAPSGNPTTIAEDAGLFAASAYLGPSIISGAAKGLGYISQGLRGVGTSVALSIGGEDASVITKTNLIRPISIGQIDNILGGTTAADDLESITEREAFPQNVKGASTTPSSSYLSRIASNNFSSIKPGEFNYLSTGNKLFDSILSGNTAADEFESISEVEAFNENARVSSRTTVSPAYTQRIASGTFSIVKPGEFDYLSTGNKLIDNILGGSTAEDEFESITEKEAFPENVKGASTTPSSSYLTRIANNDFSIVKTGEFNYLKPENIGLINSVSGVKEGVASDSEKALAKLLGIDPEDLPATQNEAITLLKKSNNLTFKANQLLDDVYGKTGPSLDYFNRIVKKLPTVQAGFGSEGYSGGFKGFTSPDSEGGGVTLTKSSQDTVQILKTETKTEQIQITKQVSISQQLQKIKTPTFTYNTTVTTDQISNGSSNLISGILGIAGVRQKNRNKQTDYGYSILAYPSGTPAKVQGFNQVTQFFNSFTQGQNIGLNAQQKQRSQQTSILQQSFKSIQLPSIGNTSIGGQSISQMLDTQQTQERKQTYGFGINFAQLVQPSQKSKQIFGITQGSQFGQLFKNLQLPTQTTTTKTTQTSIYGYGFGYGTGLTTGTKTKTPSIPLPILGKLDSDNILTKSGKYKYKYVGRRHRVSYDILGDIGKIVGAYGLGHPKTQNMRISNKTTKSTRTGFYDPGMVSMGRIGFNIGKSTPGIGFVPPGSSKTKTVKMGTSGFYDPTTVYMRPTGFYDPSVIRMPSIGFGAPAPKSSMNTIGKIFSPPNVSKKKGKSSASNGIFGWVTGASRT